MLSSEIEASDQLIVSWTIENDTTQPGAVGVVDGTFSVIVPGAEWEIEARPLATASGDLGPVLGLLVPVIWCESSAPLGFACRLIVGLPGTGFRLRIVAADYVTPIVVPGIRCGIRLYRYGPTS